MSNVLMVTQIGDQELHVGKCTHAQARIITKKKHGEIRDGKLYLQLRPIHLQTAFSQVETEPRDPNVSKAELARRMEWLKSLVGGITQAELRTNVRGPSYWQDRIQKWGAPQKRRELAEDTTMDAELIAEFTWQDELFKNSEDVPLEERLELEDLYMPSMSPERYQAVFGGHLPGEADTYKGEGVSTQSARGKPGMQAMLALQASDTKVVFSFYGLPESG
tara:strand:+ start:103 stop:762 length:660 start_codon:yes stop_codon:yes gene_type:complete